MDGIGKGIKDRMNSVAGEAIEAAKGIIANIKKELGIASPSAVFAEIGQNMMAGMAQGIADTTALPKVALSATMTQAVATTVTPAGQSGPTGNLTINVDARGSTLSTQQIKAAVMQALAQAGYQADGRMRLGVT